MTATLAAVFFAVFILFFPVRIKAEAFLDALNGRILIRVGFFKTAKRALLRAVIKDGELRIFLIKRELTITPRKEKRIKEKNVDVARLIRRLGIGRFAVDVLLGGENTAFFAFFNMFLNNLLFIVCLRVKERLNIGGLRVNIATADNNSLKIRAGVSLNLFLIRLLAIIVAAVPRRKK